MSDVQSSPLSNTSPQFAANVRKVMSLLSKGTTPKSLEGTYSRIVIQAAREEIERQEQMKRNATDHYMEREKRYGRW